MRSSPMRYRTPGLLLASLAAALACSTRSCSTTAVRGVGPLLRADVADVRGDEVEVAQAQRLEGPLVDVRHVTVANLEVIDLERVDSLQRVLPAALLDRGRVGDLLARLRQVDVDRRLLDLDVGDEAPGEQRSPVDAGAQALDSKNGRIGMSVLNDRQALQIERETQRVKVEVL